MISFGPFDLDFHIPTLRMDDQIPPEVADGMDHKDFILMSFPTVLEASRTIVEGSTVLTLNVAILGFGFVLMYVNGEEEE